MFGKLKLLNCRIFLLLVIYVLLALHVSESAEEGLCHGSKHPVGIGIGEDDQNPSLTVFEKRACSNTLRGIIAGFRRERSRREDTNSQKITKNVLSVPETILSHKKNDIGIAATNVHNGAEDARMTDTFHTKSSFSSSQPDNVISKDLEGDNNLKSDLNETNSETFHVDSDIETRKGFEHVQQPEGDFSLNESNTKTTIESSQEDIPSFREWTEKHLAEKERERSDDNATSIPSNGKNHKMRNKNFASLDCGAKLVASNPEAKSTGSLLSASRDEYLLSVCNTKIWFVVELCEAVQLKRIELANFELFSSSPKEFSVLIADRFPTRDWTVVGKFVAKDEKSVQSFDLQQNHFTKYIKIEFHSHYGKEHFCPISLFRVYGTSEFEVLETVDNEELDTDTTESDYDANEPIMSEMDNKKRKLEANNLFGSAKEAVMNIVKKAAEVLVNKPISDNSTSNGTKLSNATTSMNGVRSDANRHCVTPRYVIMCHDCREDFFHRLYHLMSCYADDLSRLLQLTLIWKPLIKYNVCLTFGIKSFYLRDHPTVLIANEKFHHNEMYIMYLFSRETIATFCNLVAVSENRLKLNITLDETLPLNQTLKRCNNVNANVKQPTYQTLYPVSDGMIATNAPSDSLISTFKTIESTSGVTASSDSKSVAMQIKPTKTTQFIDGENEKIKAQSQIPIIDEFVQPIAPASSSTPTHVPNLSNAVNNEQIKTAPEESEVPKDSDHLVEAVEDSMSLDSLISELEKTEATNSAPMATPKPAMQKESVFVKLANRIKALERNMSLSGQYLDELSRRYKKQVEDMQRMLSEMTVRETKRSQETNVLTARIYELSNAVDALIAERDSWSYKAIAVGEHSLIIFLEIVIFMSIVCICRGIPRLEISKRKFSLEWRRGQREPTACNNAPVIVQRGQSLDDLSTKKASQQHKRRPSEEAIKVDGGTHHDLLIYETNRSSKAESRRRKRKRKELLLKSNANAINLETGDVNNLMARKLTAANKNNAPLSRSASASEIDEHSWGRHVYSGTINKGSDRQSLGEQKENVTFQEANDFSTIFKTATSMRTKRLSINQFNGRNALSPVYDVSSDQDSSVPSTPIKEKKINGLKKIVRKFF